MIKILFVCHGSTFPKGGYCRLFYYKRKRLNLPGEKPTLQKGIIALLCNGKLHEKNQMYTTVGGAT